MVKRLLCICVCVSLFWGMGLLSAAAQQQRVYDGAGILTEQEESRLESAAARLRKETSLDLVIVTVQSTDGKSAQAYADDFYDAGGFGKGEDYSGVLLLIDMGACEVAVSTCGYGIRLLSDTRIDAILDEAIGYLSQGDFAQAADAFLERVESYAAQDVSHVSPEGESSHMPAGTRSWGRALGTALPISLVLGGLAVPAIYFGVGGSGKKRARSKSYRDYSFLELSHKEDRLIDKHVVTRRIPRQPPAGSGGFGGSSTHTSGSGRTHGGGARSFGGSSTRISSSGRSHGGGSRKF